MIKLILILCIPFMLLFASGCYNQAYTIKTNTTECGTFCYYAAQNKSCLQYSYRETEQYINNEYKELPVNCVCDMIECRK